MTLNPPPRYSRYGTGANVVAPVPPLWHRYRRYGTGAVIVAPVPSLLSFLPIFARFGSFLLVFAHFCGVAPVPSLWHRYRRYGTGAGVTVGTRGLKLVN